MDEIERMKARWIRAARRQLLLEDEARRRRQIEDCLFRHRWGEMGQTPDPTTAKRA